MYNESITSNIPRLEIKVLASDEKKPPCRVSNLHFHNEIEFIAVYDGLFRIVVDGESYDATAGDVIFVGSRVPHETFVIEDSRSALIQFKESSYLDNDMLRLLKYSAKLQGLSSARVKIIRNPEFFGAADEIVAESKRQENGYEFFVRSSVFRMLGTLYREGVLVSAESVCRRREVQKILPALAYIKERYAENLTLEEVSLQLNLDPSYFCRLFKKAMGATFTEYLNFVRVCKSEKLLYKTKDTILEISEAVGFSSVSYFNRMFKKYLNCTPKYYRSVSYGESVISPEE